MTQTKKPSVLDKATSHYRTQLAGELKSFEVPEWDTTIYYREITNLRSEQEVVELTKKGKSVEALVVSIINKALDEEGMNLFKPTDRLTLMNQVDPNILLSVANKINGSVPTVQELEGN